MNKKEIEELIKFVSKLQVSEVEIEDKDFKLTIVNSSKKSEVPFPPGAQPHVVAHTMPAAVQPAVVPTPAPASVPEQAPVKEEAAGTDDANLITIKSPMIGTFYRASSPEKPNFVNVGDKIEKGKVICIIEAMKLFNEIESEVSGKIVKVLVDDSTPVEYDQPLLLVDPKG
ncbi:MAG: acetyl-CoA carboxylase biotin carboxyl carrier protein [Bacteroidia bacterium]|nr:acetyl-CoA carboxylase biotin carboxyl carrier protein [Bacteroidia bacterium]NNM16379.1 acetyl-CoA carboxylase biotin carboxyl carrier protein [Bacteroidia bacterium]